MQSGEYGFELKVLAENKSRTKRSVDDYSSMTEHERAFHKCEMYIGSRDRISREDFVYDFSEKRYVMKTLSIPDAQERLFLEILTNASDNADNSRRFEVDPGSIDITMDDSWVSIKSAGEPIPIFPRNEISTPQKPLTTIDFIFGTIGSSSNYDNNVTRTGCGTNGLGAKLVNIFSQRFQVTVGDPKNGVLHTSEWSHNMRNHVKSCSTPAYVWNGSNWQLNGEPYKGEAFVEVKWKFDFRPFSCTGFNNECAELFCRHLLDISFTCKVPVSFNGIKFDVRKPSDYVHLLYPKETGSKHLIHYDWLDGKKVDIEGKKLEDFVADCCNFNCIPALEICIVDTPNNGIVLSFVNGMITRDGGAHVDVVTKVVCDAIKDFFKSDKSGAGDKINAGDIKKHISLIVNCRIGNPQYSSQSKTQLKSPKPKCVFSEKELSCIKKWKMMDTLYDTINNKLLKDAKKTDGKKKKHVYVKGAEPANWAGTHKSLDCVLMITEGNSAAGYVKKFILGKEGRKDKYGILSIRGKLLNVADASLLQIIQNEEIADIKEMLGLGENVNYLTAEGINSLRYGMVCICTDSDVDGSHINSLLINFFFHRFPTFLQSGRVSYLLTPITRVFKGKETLHRFYNDEDFENWRKTSQAQDKKLKVKYYKGLGTSTDEEIKEDLKYSATVTCIFDDQAHNSLNIAFKTENADLRKDWIQKWRYVTGIKDVIISTPNDLIKGVNISDFINTKLVEYSVDTFSRALPSFRDGLKKSQRQVLYYILHAWDYGKKNKENVKVSRLASDAGGFSKYHHGDDSLSNVIVKMVQDYPGANNLNHFIPDGQFGTRSGTKDGIGKDCSASRYISSGPEWWIKHVYKKELVSIIPKIIVEDEEAEPAWIPCDIPVHVINGCLGISTAYSTYIPNHNPIDVIDWILCYLSGDKLPLLTPWFKGFVGNVDVEIRKKTKAKLEELVELNEENDNIEEVDLFSNNGGLTLKTEGIFEIIEERTSTFKKEIDGEIKIIKEKVSDIRITEIPIGVSIFKYVEWLRNLIKEEKIEDIK
ncbi:MAG: DNA gyrase subunit A, partial [bacterium]